MKIQIQKIKIRDLVDNYLDSQDNGIVGFHGLLNVRPAFQREFIYKDEQRNEVMRTVKKGFPLNVMYWAVSNNPNKIDISNIQCTEELLNSNLKFELMDGQQRTISICQYIQGDYSIIFDKSKKTPYGYANLTEDEKEQILNYELSVYICEGTDSEKLDWFKIINIAGEVLTAQELRNAVYTGSWLSSAKSFFSKNQCTAYKIAKNYINGVAIRQDYLETALSWIADRDGISIEQYMANHQYDEDANELIDYFKSVIKWTETIYPTPKGEKTPKEMKGLKWGIWYNKYSKEIKTSLAAKVIDVLTKCDVEKTSGVYEYLITGKPSALHVRAFSDKDKSKAYAIQKGICPLCKKYFAQDQMHADHIIPWSKGGPTSFENLQMLCTECNIKKSNYDSGYSLWDQKNYKNFTL